MKKLLLGLVVLASLVSCGKDNKVSSTSTTTSLSNSLLTNNSYATDLANRISGYTTGFGEGYISNGSTTWNAVIAATPTITYQYSTGRTVRNSDVAISTKKSELIALLNSATNVTISGTIYYIQVSGAIYAIDIRYPIQANPSASQTTSYSEYLVRAI